MRALRTRVAAAWIVLSLMPACRITPPSDPLLHVEAGRPAGPSAAAAFAELKALVGPWEGTTASGRTSRVGYRASAGESVLVETWTQARGREALTIYHLDGDDLLATHYCPKGNQVRLRWSGGGPSEGMDFEFVDGTNLHAAEQSHQHAFWLKLVDADSFQRGETYVKNDTSAVEFAAQPAGEVVTYRRGAGVPSTG